MELKLKKYESKVVEILEDGSAILELPEEMCNELGWKEGDTLKIKVENDTIILEKENGCKSTN